RGRDQAIVPRPTQRPEDLGEAVPSVQAGARTVCHLLRGPHLPMRTLSCPDQARAQGWHHGATPALSTTPPRGSSRRFNLYCGVDTALTSQQRRSALHGVTQKVGQPRQAWRKRWEEITPFLNFPPEMRRAVYTTNAIEALNRQLRKI